MNWKVMSVGMLLTVPLLYILARGFEFNPRDLPDVVVGKQAPLFSRPTLEGETLSLEGLKGAPVVINFWSTTCQPCRVEHPHLISTAKRYKSKGVAFIGVLYADEAANAKRYLKKAGFAYPTVVDELQSIPIDYGVTGVPETFIINKEGIIVKKIKGAVSESMLSEILEPLL